MRTQYKKILLLLMTIVTLASGNTLPVFAESLQGKYGDRNEYYKLDYKEDEGKLIVTGVAGRYAEDVEFEEKETQGAIKIFEPKGKSIKLADRPAEMFGENGGTGCDAMPTLRWQPPEDASGNEVEIDDEDRKPVLRLFLNTRTNNIKTLITGEHGDNAGESDAFDNNAAEQFTASGNHNQYVDRPGKVYWGKVDPLIRYGVDDDEDIEVKMPTDTNGYSIQRHDTHDYEVKVYRFNNSGRDPRSTVHGLISGWSSDMGFSEEDPLQKRIERFDKLVADGDITRHAGYMSRTTLGSSNTLLCTEYNFYEHFWRFLTPYNSTQVRLGPLNGKILGLPDMAFEDWVKKGDHRLQYLAYKFSGQDINTSTCARKVDVFTCINKLDEIRRQCLARGINITREVTRQDLENIKSDVWEEEFEKDKFQECVLSHETELIDAKYFSSREEIEAYVKQIIKNTILPPSLNPEPAEPAAPVAASNATQCSIGMLSWWMCPVLSFLADINDKIFSILRNWLVIAPFSLTAPGTNDAAIDSWGKVRNLANVLFIFAFLYIIFAQISGRASTPGGLRARLPRLVIAILLANMSYIISGVAVDISNIVGDSLMLLLMSTTIGGVSADQYGSWAQIVANISLVGGAAAGTLIVVANLAALLPIMLMAVIAVVGAFIMLLFRQAITILLIVIAPLAFATLALPFTEKWFDKWKGLLLQMLYLYPAFALLFAGGNFAAEIIRANAIQKDDTLMTIFSLGIQVLPLLAIPFFIKLMSSALAAVSGKIDQATRGVRDKADKSAREYSDHRKTRQRTRALNGRMGVLGYGAFIRMNEQRKASKLNQKGNAHHAGQHLAGSSDELESSIDATVGRFASEDLRAAARRAIQSEEFKAQEEAMEARLLEVEASNSQEAVSSLLSRALAEAGDSSGANAANIKQVIDSRDVGAIDRLLDNLDRFNDFERKVIVDTIEASGIASQAAHLGNAQNLRSIREGTASGSAELYGNSVRNGDFTPEAIANQHADTIQGIAKSYGSTAAGSITESGFQSVAANYQRAAGNEKLSSRMNASTRGAADSIFTPRGGRR